MTKEKTTFVNVLGAVLHEQMLADPGPSRKEWEGLLHLAENSKLMPLILDAVCGLPSCRAALSVKPEQMETSVHIPRWRELALEQAAKQAIQENEFLNLILALRERGLEPLVVKGAVCRKLYPKPLLRPSVDDDLLYNSASLSLGSEISITLRLGNFATLTL